MFLYNYVIECVITVCGGGPHWRSHWIYIYIQLYSPSMYGVGRLSCWSIGAWSAFASCVVVGFQSQYMIKPAEFLFNCLFPRWIFVLARWRPLWVTAVSAAVLRLDGHLDEPSRRLVCRGLNACYSKSCCIGDGVDHARVRRSGPSQ